MEAKNFLRLTLGTFSITVQYNFLPLLYLLYTDQRESIYLKPQLFFQSCLYRPVAYQPAKAAFEKIICAEIQALFMASML